MPVSLRDSYIKFYRVENERGEGPFQHAETQKILSSMGLMPIGDPRKPAGEEDVRIRDIFLKYCQSPEGNDWLFGFRDMSQYDLWFGDEDIQEILACANFSLQKYMIDPQFVHAGTNQLIFWRPAALQCSDP